MSVTLSISAVDLHYINVNTERINLGDQIRVVSLPHGLDTFFLCSKVVLHFDDPSSDEYTLGVGFSGLTDKQIANQKKSDNAFNVAESASGAVSSVSTIVSGNYVSKSEFTSFQSQVNRNFTSVSQKITSVYTVKGSVASFEELPSTGRSIGDVWNVLDTGANYVFTSDGWDKLSETVDLSGYATKEEIPDVTGFIDAETFADLLARVEALENKE